MSAIETFRFNGFTLRPAGTGIKDYRLVALWVAEDPAHRDTLRPDFWVEQGLRRDSYVLEDGEGPVLFFKMHGHGPIPYRSDFVELFVQFPPAKAGSGPEMKRRILRLQSGLAHGFEWLLRVLQQNGVREVFFDSRSETLIRYCTKELGFTRQGERLTKRVDPEPTRG